MTGSLYIVEMMSSSGYPLGLLRVDIITVHSGCRRNQFYSLNSLCWIQNLAYLAATWRSHLFLSLTTLESRNALIVKCVTSTTTHGKTHANMLLYEATLLNSPTKKERRLVLAHASNRRFSLVIICGALVFALATGVPFPLTPFVGTTYWVRH